MKSHQDAHEITPCCFSAHGRRRPRRSAAHFVVHGGLRPIRPPLPIHRRRDRRHGFQDLEPRHRRAELSDLRRRQPDRLFHATGFTSAATGLAGHIMGPWYLDAAKTQNFPNFPSNTAKIYRIPRVPVDSRQQDADRSRRDRPHGQRRVDVRHRATPFPTSMPAPPTPRPSTASPATASGTATAITTKASPSIPRSPIRRETTITTTPSRSVCAISSAITWTTTPPPTATPKAPRR